MWMSELCVDMACRNMSTSYLQYYPDGYAAFHVFIRTTCKITYHHTSPHRTVATYTVCVQRTSGHPHFNAMQESVAQQRAHSSRQAVLCATFACASLTSMVGQQRDDADSRHGNRERAKEKEAMNLDVGRGGESSGEQVFCLAGEKERVDQREREGRDMHE
jgi:hypothetical protein